MSDFKFLLWMDLETAGTDERKDPILEVAAILTDLDLTVLAAYETPVWPEQWDREEAVPAGIDPYVLRMHAESGLWDACASDGISLHHAESELILRLSMSGDRGDFVLAGSGVSHFDRRFIDYQMPRLSKWLRYYSIDVGVLRRTLQVISRDDLVPIGAVKPHRAMADVRLHLDELRHYRTVLGALRFLGTHDG